MKKLTLREARDNSGLTADQVAVAAECDRATLYRIEKGEQQPKRPTARRLFELYRGRVPLELIYDPEYAQQIRQAS